MRNIAYRFRIIPLVLLCLLYLQVVNALAGPAPHPIQTYSSWRLTHYEIAEPDDPYTTDGSVATVDKLAAAARAAGHSPWLTFFDCKDSPPYRRDMDGMASDNYVFYNGLSTGFARTWWIDAVGYCVRIAKQLHLPAPTMITQAFGGVWDGPYQWRCPSPAEFAWTVNRAYQLGAGNVIAYTIPGHSCPGLPV